MSYSALINNNTEARVSQNTLNSIANQPSVITGPQINVGDYPHFIDSAYYVYVANAFSDTISIIDPVKDTVIKSIPVGVEPTFISSFIGDPLSGYVIYVANLGSDTVPGTVSVIDPAKNHTVIKTITTVGNGSSFINTYDEQIADGTTYIYVANSGSGTVSVIDPVNNTVIKNITVGEYPEYIDIDYSVFGDSIYVANRGSDTVSVIDPLTNDVVAGVTFDIGPFNGGQIICNGLDAPINRYFYVSSGAECIAKPNNGYEFASWVEMFDDNSTRTINASTTSDWLVDPVAAFCDAFTDDPAATLTVNRFGNFTAYFKALPPPVPAEFTASIITVIVAAFVGSLLIPATVGWVKTKKQTSRLNSFHLVMVSINKDGLNEKDVGDLNELNQNISNSYAAGKITNGQYTNLKNEVSAAYQKIFKKRIESITSPNTESANNIKNDIEDAYSDRKITELDYNLLNAKISRMLDKK